MLPRIQKNRFYTQLFFLALTIWIGIEFYLFVGWLESAGTAQFYARPPGVEAFLPISSLMSLLLFFKTGNIHQIHPAGLFIFVAILSVSLIFKVCKPDKLQAMPSAKQVTAIVCAISGASFKFLTKISLLVFFSLVSVIQSSPKVVATPKCL